MNTKIAAILLLGVLLAACSPAADRDNGPEVVIPTGEDELILSISYEGGFLPVEASLAAMPDFALYGDGRVFTQGPQIMIFPGPALPNTLVRSIDREGVEAIVARAVQAGLTGPDRRFDDAASRIADAPDTVFTLVTGEGEHTTSVYALSTGEELAGVSGDDQQTLRALQALREDLTDLESWLPEGSVRPEDFYLAERMRIFVTQYQADPEPELAQTEMAWPLEGPLTEFGEPVAPEGYRCGVVEGQDLGPVLEAAGNANRLTPWVDGTGAEYAVTFRPMLPDESGC